VDNLVALLNVGGSNLFGRTQTNPIELAIKGNKLKVDSKMERQNR